MLIKPKKYKIQTKMLKSDVFFVNYLSQIESRTGPATLRQRSSERTHPNRRQARSAATAVHERTRLGQAFRARGVNKARQLHRYHRRCSK